MQQLSSADISTTEDTECLAAAEVGIFTDQVGQNTSYPVIFIQYNQVIRIDCLVLVSNFKLKLLGITLIAVTEQLNFYYLNL
jgi:hypothetical protein